MVLEEGMAVGAGGAARGWNDENKRPDIARKVGRL